MIGRTIGKYRIVGQIGRGGAGIVYRAIDETLQRDVAIKTLNPDLANTEVMKRFRSEATTLAKLNHPHIATIYELFRSDTDLLMVMEFVRGETLDKLSGRVGPIPPEGAAYLIDRILSGLEHAHRAGVVHRDMKPANVMVTEGGGVKIMDFGIARVRGVEQMTLDQRLMGTPAYMPPEQVLGQEVDGRADLYSVGVLFYRLLTASLPFKADTALAMMQRQILEPPTPMHVHRPDLPDWCEPMVLRALAKATDERFQTAEEFREELRRATGVLVTADFAQSFALDLPSGDTLNLSQLGAESSVPDATRPPARSWRRTLVWANAAAAILAIASALGYVELQPPADPSLAAPAPAYAAGETATAPGALPGALTVQPLETPVPNGRALNIAAPNAAASDGPASNGSASNGSASNGSAADTPLASDVDAPVQPVALPAPRRAAEPVAAAPVPRRAIDASAEAAAPRSTRAASKVLEPLLVFNTKTLVGTKKPREHEARLVLADGKITVTSDLESEYPFYTIPYDSVVSITYSRGRDPMWNSPEGPLPLTRGGGALGRIGIVVARDWIALRTTTVDQFVAMRFDDVLVRRVLLALEERTGCKPELMAAPKDGR